ncbi:hypothetical protein CYMTET_12433 [Cymbomonas tetramitiformis]|uniref:Fatty acid hydroxylase domain-containing protein n=1 Tax=Cymbomonas tetramitiformis TaxID=36881 RepID=A0AAE0LC56_9CHLO|nr:hypothetical protein CYMTET_51722 [Cymbomonas tetramitiformis]KAK3279692.1 hypothetical protein CYMTET_12433 [Cymbomonas tetramitiformis]|eukprot:gene2839-3637_t
MDLHLLSGTAVFSAFAGMTMYSELSSEWNWGQAFMFGFAILAGMELMSASVHVLFGGFSAIPIRAAHLDAFDFKDMYFIFLNKICTVPFMYHYNSICLDSAVLKMEPKDLTFANSVGGFIALFLVYDFIYALYHRFLHVRGVYSLVHKHHHRQHSPTRGNPDGVNVHPLEFLLGEYNFLLAVYLVKPHAYAAMAFIVIGGVMASLNHTRTDFCIPYVYDVKAHDVHHRIPQSNYGQFISVWDRCMGSFREYHDTVDKRK